MIPATNGPDHVAGIFFDDLTVGEVHRTAARTITEADIVSFAGLSGDYNGLHVDAEYAASTPFGGRIAHGLLVLSVSSGLCTRLALSEGLQPNIEGLLDLQCTWPAPTKIGDTVHVLLTITHLKRTSQPHRGVVTMARNTFKQDGTQVMDSTWKLLIRSNHGSHQGAN